jgi:hypothetical protein
MNNQLDCQQLQLTTVLQKRPGTTSLAQGNTGCLATKPRFDCLQVMLLNRDDALVMQAWRRQTRPAKLAGRLVATSLPGDYGIGG